MGGKQQQAAIEQIARESASLAPVLKAGDVVIQRGTHHAWSNRSGRPAAVAIAAHDGAW